MTSMDSGYFLNISIVDAIGIWNILKCLAILAIELGVCFFFLRQHPKLPKRMMIVIIILFLLSFVFQTDALYWVWCMVMVTVTGVFANTKLGFAARDETHVASIKIDPYLQNLMLWLVMVVLSYSLGIGANILASVWRGPQTVQKEVSYVFHEKDGGLILAFMDENDWGFDVHVSKEYTHYIKDGDCLELTYFTPYDPFGNLDYFATQIRSSDKCTGGV
jgi:hypothetical protein